MQTYFYTFPVSWAHCLSIDIAVDKVIAPSCSYNCRDKDLTFLKRESMLDVILFTAQKCSDSHLLSICPRPQVTGEAKIYFYFSKTVDFYLVVRVFLI